MEGKTHKSLSRKFLISWILLVLFTCEHYSISFFVPFTYKHCSIMAHILLPLDYCKQLFTVDMFLLFMWVSWICFGSYIKKFGKVLLRSSHQSCSVRIGVLRNFTKLAEKHLCKSSFLIKLQACNFIKKENSCEFCEISKNTFFREHLRTSAFVFCTFFVIDRFLRNQEIVIFS